MNQLPLFCDDEMMMGDGKLTYTNEDALGLLRNGADLVLSISGGKDSEAMSNYLIDLHDENRWTGKIYLVHADLGRAEWDITEDYVKEYAARKGYHLHIVKHAKYDLIEGIRQRMHKRPDAPPFPSSKARYCTSDWKRAVIDKWLHHQFPENANVVVAMGFRADESPARAKRPVMSLRENASAPTKNRMVYDWLPIHTWNVDQVWKTVLPHIGWTNPIEWYRTIWKQFTGLGLGENTLREFMDFVRTLRGNVLPCHPAYMIGNERLSCAMCVLASENDLLNGAIHNPETYIELCKIEVESGFSFRQKMWLGSLKPELLPADLKAWYVEKGYL